MTWLGKLPNVIAITETKLSTKFSSVLRGYKFEQSNSKTLAGGVGLLIGDSLDYQIINDYSLNVEECEELWAKVTLCYTEIIFCVIYRHPIPKFSEFQSSLEYSLEKLNEQKSDGYFCGDFNIDLLKSNTNPSINNYSNNLFSLGCLSLIKFSSWITPTSTTLIDQ